ncbi:MAG: GNAT family N-acetyltransferase [Bacteroidota bacterium]|nr:GNAT family N-acetyltransferase [Bacteroidota bacterium]
MNLRFYEISASDTNKIKESYRIIKECGEYMYKELGLCHWKTPYPIDSIQNDCTNRHVFLVEDLDSGRYVHTFQIEISYNVATIAKLYKMATLPLASGQGIGMSSMAYIEDFCHKAGVYSLYLDVYDKSENAIQFFKKHHFSITGSRPTTYFRVYIMEKVL